ncbi:hypothetical protein HK105_203450 [Polyrhizophydium stewartii]|uniref:RGS domain-containing protein n=1 Tax=Polyrhizophydium stewartii TaxID=2732419 RepID=A0ABR4NBU6_9FUNG
MFIDMGLPLIFFLKSRRRNISTFGSTSSHNFSWLTRSSRASTTSNKIPSSPSVENTSAESMTVAEARQQPSANAPQQISVSISTDAGSKTEAMSAPKSVQVRPMSSASPSPVAAAVHAVQLSPPTHSVAADSNKRSPAPPRCAIRAALGGHSTSSAEPKQLTIADILESRHLRDAFAKLLAREFAVEGLLFVQTVLQYKRQFQQLSIRPSDTQIAASAASVFRYFLDPNAANEVLLPKKIVDKATIVFETQVQHGCGVDLDVAAKLFDEAAAHVARMLAANHLSKFVLSSAYKDAAAAEEAELALENAGR